LQVATLLCLLQSVSIDCYADALSWLQAMSVRPSVCLSHPAALSKRRKLESRKLHSPLRKRHYFQHPLNFLINSKGVTPTEGGKQERVGKICDFQPIRGRTSETVRDRAKVTINHYNRKSHVLFLLLPKSTTSDDLELLYCTLLHK